MRMPPHDKALDWYLGDIKQRLGFRGGKYTDVNPWCALALSLVSSGALFLALCYLPATWRATKGVALLLDRGWTLYAMVGLFLLAMVTLLRKQEEAFLDACRDYVHVNLISRLERLLAELNDKLPHA